jgi:hypothetical protein
MRLDNNGVFVADYVFAACPWAYCRNTHAAGSAQSPDGQPVRWLLTLAEPSAPAGHALSAIAHQCP